jgi:hypothetical protein
MALLLVVSIAAGDIPGIAGAVLGGRLLLSLVDGAESLNAVAYVAPVLGMALIATMGIWVRRPASPARLDIMEILRTGYPLRVCPDGGTLA